jgi:hypothetical protein
LLIARSGAAGSGSAPVAKPPSGAPSGTGGSGQLVQSRSFTPKLLPQYAAYIVTVAALLVMGWYTLRRRNGHASVSVTEPARDAAQALHSARKE